MADEKPMTVADVRAMLSGRPFGQVQSKLVEIEIPPAADQPQSTVNTNRRPQKAVRRAGRPTMAELVEADLAKHKEF